MCMRLSVKLISGFIPHKKGRTALSAEDEQFEQKKTSLIQACLNQKIYNMIYTTLIFSNLLLLQSQLTLL